MSYDLYTGAPDDQQAKVAYLMQLFQYARINRVNFEVQWEEASSLVWPDYRNSFAFGHVRSPGVKYAQFQVDSTASVKAQRFMAIADYMLTPFNQIWSRIEVNEPALKKDPEVAQWLDDVTRIMWVERYRASANFITQQQTNWLALGVFGNVGMFIDEYDPKPLKGDKGLRYMACSPGEIYLLQNHQGRIDGYIRHFRWTGREAYNKWGMAIPPQLAAAAEKADVYTKFDFLEFVIPRTDYDPMSLFSNQGKPWSSIYVSVVGYNILEEGGYYTLPLPHGRYFQAPEEWYGRGPAQIVLAELKTKNSGKEAYFKQAKLAGDPAYLLPNDGLFDFKLESGSFNFGAITEDGKKLVDVLPTGNIQITKEMMEDSDKIIDAAFLNDLFPLLFDKSGAQRSARETVEVTRQMAVFLAPTLGRQYGEYLNTMHIREFDLLNRQRKIPPLPAAMREAKSGVHIRYNSPLAQAFEMEGIGGFMRSVEMAGQVAQATGDQSVFDPFDFDAAIPEMSTAQHTPARWMASPKAIASKRKGRADAQERENQVKELPGKAAIIKAQAIEAKAQTGGNIGGTLSGTPAGGMPMVPGNPAGQQGQPGVFGMPGLSGQPG